MRSEKAPVHEACSRPTGVGWRFALLPLLIPLVLLGSPADLAHSRESSGNPEVTIQGAAAPLLLERCDQGLQAAVEESLASLDLTDLTDAARLGIAVVDVNRPELPAFAAVNGDRMFYAASLPKIAVLLSWFEAVERGAVVSTARLERAVVRMIRFSDNRATNAVLGALGFPTVARTLEKPRYRLYDPSLGGGLWVGKAYGENRYWKRDPLADLSHAATPRQVARFFVLLDRGELVSSAASRAMKEILARPGIDHKFVRALASRPETRIFRKSGTWRNYHADAALVEGPRARYVLVGLVRDPRGEEILQRIARTIDDLMTSRLIHATASEREDATARR